MVVSGSVSPGWERVADAFQTVLSGDGGAGSAFCVYVDGQPVVDVWGGDAGGTRRWKRDTAACVFSATKGIASICAHLLIQRGLLDLDAPVAQYWPEFAAGDKHDLLVRWLLSHQAGLITVDAELTLADLEAGGPVVQALEVQTPQWRPGTQHGYHALTFGFLLGELVRRVTGATLGAYFHDEIARPLALNSWIGLPRDLDIDVATLERDSDEPNMLETLVAADPEGPLAAIGKMLTLGGALPLGLLTDGNGDFNDRRVLAIEIPAAGMVSDARSLARAYAATVSDVDGVRLLTDASAAACVPVHTSGTSVFGAPPDAPRTLDFGLGFLSRPLLGDACFGHPGASGALGFADTSRRLAFGYVPRLMRPEGADQRTAALLDAVREVVG